MRRSSSRFYALLGPIVLLALFALPFASGAQYHISSTASAGGDGSSGTPWLTLDEACASSASASADELVFHDVGPVTLSAECSLPFATLSCIAAGGVKCSVSAGPAAVLVFTSDSTTLSISNMRFIKSTDTTNTAFFQVSRNVDFQSTAFTVSKLFLSIGVAGATVAIKDSSVTGFVLLNSYDRAVFSLAASSNLVLDTVTVSSYALDGPLIDATGAPNANVTIKGSSFTGLQASSLSAGSGAILSAVQASVIDISQTAFSSITVGASGFSSAVGEISLIHIVDSATSSGASSTTSTSVMSISGCSFTNNAILANDRSGLVSVSGIASYLITGNSFNGNSANACALLRIVQSSGTVSNNQFNATALVGYNTLNSPSDASVCVDYDFSAVNSSLSATEALNTFTGNTWNDITFPNVDVTTLQLELMSNRSYPLTAYAVSANYANVSFANNNWSSNNGLSMPYWQTLPTSIPALFFNQSTVTFNEDVAASGLSDINGIVEVASTINLQSNLTTTLLGAYGANSIRLSRYNLNGHSLTTSRYASPISTNSSAITGGFFDNGVLQFDSPVFVCCGYIPQAQLSITEEFDSLVFNNVEVIVDDFLAIVRTTNAVVFNGGKLTVSSTGTLLAPRPISPNLVTGLHPATINGSVVVSGVLQAIDLEINGDLTATTNGVLEVSPTTFRGVAHGIKLNGDLTVLSSNTQSLQLTSNRAAPFGSSKDLIGAAFPPSIRLSSSGDANATVFTYPAGLVGAPEGLFPFPATTSTLSFISNPPAPLVVARKRAFNIPPVTNAAAVAVVPTQRYDKTGRAVYVTSPIPIRSEVSINGVCGGLLLTSSASGSYDLDSLNCSWVDAYTVMVTSNVLPSSGNCLALDVNNAPFSNPTDCFIDSSDLLPPVPRISQVSNPFYDLHKLTLDGRGSFYLGPDPSQAAFAWKFNSSSVSDNTALVAFLATLSGPLVEVPVSYLEDSQSYNFTLEVTNPFFVAESSILTVFFESACQSSNDRPHLVIEQSQYDVYYNESTIISGRFDMHCARSVDLYELTWYIVLGEMEVPITSEHSNSVLMSQFTPLLNISGFFTNGNLEFNTPYTLMAKGFTQTESLILATTTIVLRYPPPRVTISIPSISFMNNDIVFDLLLEDRTSPNCLTGSSVTIIPKIDTNNLRVYVMSCPTDIAAEINMPFGDVKPAPLTIGGMSTDACPYADRSQGWFAIPFNFENSQMRFTIPTSTDSSSGSLEEGRYVFAVDWIVSTIGYANLASGTSTGTTIYTNGNTELGTFASQISLLSYIDDWATIWNSPSRRIVLQVTPIDYSCDNCVYNWYFPNGDLILPSEQTSGPFLVLLAGSLPAGANLTIGCNITEATVLPPFDIGPPIAIVSKRDFSIYGSTATFNLVVGQKPFGGVFEVSSLGSTNGDVFNLSTSSWESYYPELSYYHTIVTPDDGNEWVLNFVSPNGTLTDRAIPYWCSDSALRDASARRALPFCTIRVHVIDGSNSFSQKDYETLITGPVDSMADTLDNAIEQQANSLDLGLPEIIQSMNYLSFVASRADIALLQFERPPSKRSSAQSTADSNGQTVARVLSDGIQFISAYPLTESITPAVAHAILLTIRNAAQYNLFALDKTGALASSILDASLSTLKSLSHISVSSYNDDFSASILESFMVIANQTSTVNTQSYPTSADLLSELGISIFASLYGSASERFTFSSISFEAAQFTYRSTESSVASLSAGTSTVTTISTGQDLSAVQSTSGVFRAAVTVSENSGLLPTDAAFRRTMTLSLPFQQSLGVRRSVTSKSQAAADYSPVRKSTSAFRRALYAVQSFFYGTDAEAEHMNAQRHAKLVAAYDARRGALAGSSIEFTSNFSIPLTISKGTASCATYNPDSDNWSASSCSTKTGANGVVTCTCSASQTQTTLSVLFGQLGDSKKSGLSKGGIAAAVIFPLIILAVLAVVLVNLFVPALACGPFKRHHNRGKDLNAIQMQDVGAQAGPPRTAAASSSSASAPLVAPAPLPATSTYAPPAMAPEHAPTPDPTPSTGWSKATTSTTEY